MDRETVKEGVRAISYMQARGVKIVRVRVREESVQRPSWTQYFIWGV